MQSVGRSERFWWRGITAAADEPSHAAVDAEHFDEAMASPVASRPFTADPAARHSIVAFDPRSRAAPQAPVGPPHSPRAWSGGYGHALSEARFAPAEAAAHAVQATPAGPSPNPATLAALAIDQPRTVATPRRAHRAAPRSRALTRFVAALCVVALAAGGGWMWFAAPGSSGLADSSPPFAARLDALAMQLGLELREVSLSGQKNTLDTHVYRAVEAVGGRSLVTLDVAAVRAAVERLPWVETASITRVWPNRLDVRVQERMPFAVWRHDGREHLIDRSGRVLSALLPGAAHGLPVVVGAGAAEAAAGIVAQVEARPALGRLVAKFERVGRRRWTLVLNDGRRILLPAVSAGAEAGVLDDLVADPSNRGLISMGFTELDLRASDRIVVRGGTSRAAHAASAGRPSRPVSDSGLRADGGRG